MRGKLWFVGGLAAGFVLGARAGREKYEELVIKGRKVLDHPTVQEAAGVAQAQANRLVAEGKDRLSQTRLGEKLSTGTRTSELTAADDALAGTPASVGSTTGTTGTSTSRSKTTGTGTSTNSTTF